MHCSLLEGGDGRLLCQYESLNCCYIAKLPVKKIRLVYLEVAFPFRKFSLCSSQDGYISGNVTSDVSLSLENSPLFLTQNVVIINKIKKLLKMTQKQTFPHLCGLHVRLWCSDKEAQARHLLLLKTLRQTMEGRDGEEDAKHELNRTSGKFSSKIYENVRKYLQRAAFLL